MVMVMVMVMVIRLGLYRSLPCYLGSSFGPARRVLRRASNAGEEKPSLARPHFAGLSRLRYGIIRHRWRWVVGGWGPAP